jgi:hypothetical protein
MRVGPPIGRVIRSRIASHGVGSIDLLIPKLLFGSHFPSLLEPRRRHERALRSERRSPGRPAAPRQKGILLSRSGSVVLRLAIVVVIQAVELNSSTWNHTVAASARPPWIYTMSCDATPWAALDSARGPYTLPCGSFGCGKGIDGATAGSRLPLACLGCTRPPVRI